MDSGFIRNYWLIVVVDRNYLRSGDGAFSITGSCVSRKLGVTELQTELINYNKLSISHWACCWTSLDIDLSLSSAEAFWGDREDRGKETDISSDILGLALHQWKVKWPPCLLHNKIPVVDDIIIIQVFSTLDPYLAQSSGECILQWQICSCNRHTFYCTWCLWT